MNVGEPTLRAPRCAATGNRPVAARLARLVVIAVAHAFALSAQAAGSDRLDRDDARHLLARTGFGPTAAEVAAFTGLTRDQAVDRLLAGARRVAITPPPASAVDASPLRPPRDDTAPIAQRQAFVREQARATQELRAWWLHEMRVTPSPLTERMTLFWHNHFVSAQPKVRSAQLMVRQNVTLREHALGSFAALLHAMARDPAMLVYLDGRQNRRGAPNENFAREVMELFTLGEGHYGEHDVKEAARAFTGMGVSRETGEFVFRPAWHDAGPKTVLGTSGRLDADAVLDLLLAQPQTARHIVARLWREFVSPEPDAASVERLAVGFRQSNYDLTALLRGLLTDDAFFAPDNRGVLVKSPVELVVGALRQLDVAPTDTLPFAVAAAGMGQNLFAPPNVKGWPGGVHWINSATLLARKQFVDRLLRVDERSPAVAAADPGTTSPPSMADAGAAAGDAQSGQRALPMLAIARRAANPGFDSARWLATLDGGTPEARQRDAARVLLPLPPQEPAPTESGPLAVVRALLQDPAYQLK